MTDELDFDLDELMRWYDERVAAKKLRSENPYVRDMIEVLLPHRNGLGPSWVYDAMDKRRRAKGLAIPPTFEAAVRSAYNQHCVDSSVWLKRGSPEADGLFRSLGDKANRKWAVYPDKAADWLRSKIGSVS